MNFSASTDYVWYVDEVIKFWSTSTRGETTYTPRSRWRPISVSPNERVSSNVYLRALFCEVARPKYNVHIYYRQDCRVAANCRYCFYSQAKNQVFRPAGATRCTDSGQTLQDRRTPRSAWLCKISRESVQTGGNAAPKISKMSTFW